MTLLDAMTLAHRIDASCLCRWEQNIVDTDNGHYIVVARDLASGRRLLLRSHAAWMAWLLKTVADRA